MIHHSHGQHYRNGIVLFILAIALSVPKAMAFPFGNLMGTMEGSNAAAPADEPDAFIQSVKSSEKLMYKSTTILVRCLADKESVATIEAEKKAAKAMDDPKERQARLTEVKQNKQAVLYEVLNNDQFQAEIQKMDAPQKAALGAAAFNFALTLLQGKALMEQSAPLISHMSSKPELHSKLGIVKEAALSVSNRVSSASTIADKIPDIFFAVGMRGPVSKDEAPKFTSVGSDPANTNQPPEGPPNTPY